MDGNGENANNWARFAALSQSTLQVAGRATAQAAGLVWRGTRWAWRTAQPTVRSWANEMRSPSFLQVARPTTTPRTHGFDDPVGSPPDSRDNKPAKRTGQTDLSLVDMDLSQFREEPPTKKTRWDRPEDSTLNREVDQLREANAKLQVQIQSEQDKLVAAKNDQEQTELENLRILNRQLSERLRAMKPPAARQVDFSQPPPPLRYDKLDLSSLGSASLSMSGVVSSTPAQTVPEGQTTPKLQGSFDAAPVVDQQSAGLFPTPSAGRNGSQISQPSPNSSAGISGVQPISGANSLHSTVSNSQLTKIAVQQQNLTATQTEIDLDASLTSLLGMQGMTLITGLTADLAYDVTRAEALSLLQSVLFTLKDKNMNQYSVKTIVKRVREFSNKIVGPFGTDCPNGQWNLFNLSLRFMLAKLEKTLSELQLAAVSHMQTGDWGSSSSMMDGQGSSVFPKLAKTAISNIPQMKVENFDAWITQFENVVVKNLNLSLDDIKMTLTSKFDLKHSSHLRMVNELNSWTAIKEKLNELFSSTPTRLAVLAGWRNLSQGSMTVPEYNSTVMDLLYKSDALHDTCHVDRLYSYVYGLTEPRLQARLLCKIADESRSHKLSDLMTMAKTSEQATLLMSGGYESAATVAAAGTSTATVAPTGSVSPGMRKREIINPNAKCDLHFEADHTNAECNRKEWACPYCAFQGVASDFLNRKHASTCKAMRCYQCKRLGHKAAECRNRAGGDTPRRDRKDRDSRSRSRDRDYKRDDRNRNRSASRSPSRFTHARRPGTPTGPLFRDKKVAIADEKDDIN